MAQDFERNAANAVGTSAVTLRTANSDDAIVGITIANVTTSQITVEVYSRRPCVLFQIRQTKLFGTGADELLR